MSMTTKVVSSNPVYREVYSIKQYVVFTTNKTDRHDIAEILLKVGDFLLKRC